MELSASQVRTIIVAGEPGGSIPAVRAQLAGLWPGARVFDHHGMTEVGPVTYECPARPGMLHVIESAYLAEVLEPGTGKPVPPGGTGELVLTTLGRIASPLLRYRTGDVVKLQNPTANSEGHLRQQACKCGRYELVLDGGILGRTDDMVVVRGVNVYPSAVEEIVRGCGGVAEYRVEVSVANSLTELGLMVEPLSDCGDPAALVRRLQNAFETTLALRVPVSLAQPGSLPRWEMKSQRWQVSR